MEKEQIKQELPKEVAEKYDCRILPSRIVTPKGREVDLMRVTLAQAEQVHKEFVDAKRNSPLVPKENKVVSNKAVVEKK